MYFCKPVTPLQICME